ncbi:MAG: YceI family protein, partial [Ignavibacteria bacterium]|nr:YceI family protein [Ignavibacteria bacterium]
MKRIFYLAASVLFIAACSQGPKTSEDAKEVKEASEAAVLFTVDKQNSVLNWEGAKITETVHHGSINLSEGSLSVTDGNLVAGSFTVDMASITNADLTEETGKLKLEGHLKSGDFFNVAEFPTAKFEITAVQALEGVEGSTHTITGNLTIKDITNSISFP